MKDDKDFQKSDLVKNSDGTDFNPVVNFVEVRRAQLAKYTLLTSKLRLWDLSNLLRFLQMLKRERKRERGAVSNGKLTSPFHP